MYMFKKSLMLSRKQYETSVDIYKSCTTPCLDFPGPQFQTTGVARSLLNKQRDYVYRILSILRTNANLFFFAIHVSEAIAKAGAAPFPIHSFLASLVRFSLSNPLTFEDVETCIRRNEIRAPIRMFFQLVAATHGDQHPYFICRSRIISLLPLPLSVSLPKGTHLSSPTSGSS